MQAHNRSDLILEARKELSRLLIEVTGRARDYVEQAIVAAADAQVLDRAGLHQLATTALHAAYHRVEMARACRLASTH